jgi:hypothetical protein
MKGLSSSNIARESTMAATEPRTDMDTSLSSGQREGGKYSYVTKGN